MCSVYLRGQYLRVQVAIIPKKQLIPAILKYYDNLAQTNIRNVVQSTSKHMISVILKGGSVTKYWSVSNKVSSNCPYTIDAGPKTENGNVKDVLNEKWCGVYEN